MRFSAVVMGLAARRVLFPSILALVGATAWGQSGGRVASTSAGERAYQKCYACHTLEETDPDMQGPSLKAIVGRRVASQPGFTYSPALLSYVGKQQRWDRKALDAFIADPQRTIPGNRMGFFGIRDAEERKALIDYLASTGHGG